MFPNFCNTKLHAHFISLFLTWYFIFHFSWHIVCKHAEWQSHFHGDFNVLIRQGCFITLKLPKYIALALWVCVVFYLSRIALKLSAATRVIIVMHTELAAPIRIVSQVVVTHPKHTNQQALTVKEIIQAFWKCGDILCWTVINLIVITLVSASNRPNPLAIIFKPLPWRHNDRDGVSNHQHLDCLLNRLFGCISKKTSKLYVIGLCEGNPPVTGGFPSQRTSNAENVSICWRHRAIVHDVFKYTLIVIVWGEIPTSHGLRHTGKKTHPNSTLFWVASNREPLTLEPMFPHTVDDTSHWNINISITRMIFTGAKLDLLVYIEKTWLTSRCRTLRTQIITVPAELHSS